MPPTETKDNREWISQATAATLLDVSVPVVRSLIDRGLISVRRIPGCQPRVRRSEVLELAMAHIRPAVSPFAAVGKPDA